MTTTALPWITTVPCLATPGRGLVHDGLCDCLGARRNPPRSDTGPIPAVLLATLPTPRRPR